MMHRGAYRWGCGPSSGGGPWEAASAWMAAESFGSGAFGVRRPLRFLAMRLGHDEPQLREVARVLDEVKTCGV
jgi:hypothetical protein